MRLLPRLAQCWACGLLAFQHSRGRLCGKRRTGHKDLRMFVIFSCSGPRFRKIPYILIPYILHRFVSVEIRLNTQLDGHESRVTNSGLLRLSRAKHAFSQNMNSDRLSGLFPKFNYYMKIRPVILRVPSNLVLIIWVENQSSVTRRILMPW